MNNVFCPYDEVSIRQLLCHLLKKLIKEDKESEIKKH